MNFKNFFVIIIFTICFSNLNAQDDGFVSDDEEFSNDDFGGEDDNFGGGDDNFGGGDEGFGGESGIKEISVDSILAERFKDFKPQYSPDGSAHGDPRSYVEPQFVNKDTVDAITNGSQTLIKRPYLVESDIKFRKRIWRRIDLNHKENLVWRWPGAPVTKVIHELILNGVIPCYHTDSFEHGRRGFMSPEEVMKEMKYLKDTSILKAEHLDKDDPSSFYDTKKPAFYKWSDILMFEIVEDWVFDYKHGSFEPIIIGIAPVLLNVTGADQADNPFRRDLSMWHETLYWVKMDDLRPTLAQCEVFNRYNDAQRSNWDRHINDDRRFDSYIVKESNVYNQYIHERPETKYDKIAAKLEGERIKNDLFIFEHDLFEY